MTASRIYLIDSHILIWSLYEPEKLASRYHDILRGPAVTWISAATVWEVEIKKKIGKLPLPEAIWDQSGSVGHRFLSIEASHAKLAGTLPLHHTDPFDRMLIAQAQMEGLAILTIDPAFSAYDVAIA